MTTSSTTRLRRSPAQRTQLLRAFRASGLSQGAFAAQAGIGLSTLQLWLRSARPARTETPSFVELPNPLPTAAAPPAYRLRWADGLVLELGRGWVPAELAALLPLLEGRCSR
jgi:hypothetical protein